MSGAQTILEQRSQMSMFGVRASNSAPGVSRSDGMDSHMKYSVSDLKAAANAGVISPVDLERLLAFMSGGGAGDASPPAKFDAAHLLWYAGALIVVGAMGLFSTVAFSQLA